MHCLICMRIADIPANHVPVKSVVRQCMRCSQNVWATPASLIHAGGRPVFVCNHCIQFDELAQTVPPSASQLREVREVLGG